MRPHVCTRVMCITRARWQVASATCGSVHTGTFAHGRPPQVSTPLDVLVIKIVFLRCCYYASCVRASARRGAARLLRTPVLAASYRTQVSVDSCLRVTSTRKQPLGTCVALWKTKQREHHVYNGQPLRHPLLKFLLVRFRWVDMWERDREIVCAPSCFCVFVTLGDGRGLVLGPDASACCRKKVNPPSVQAMCCAEKHPAVINQWKPSFNNSLPGQLAERTRKQTDCTQQPRMLAPPNSWPCQEKRQGRGNSCLHYNPYEPCHRSLHSTLLTQVRLQPREVAPGVACPLELNESRGLPLSGVTWDLTPANTAIRTRNFPKHVHENAIKKVEEEHQSHRGADRYPTHRPLRQPQRAGAPSCSGNPSTKFRQTAPRDASTAALSRSGPRPAVFLLPTSPTEEFNKSSAPPSVLFFSRLRRTFDSHQVNCLGSTTKASTKEKVRHWSQTPVLVSLDIETRSHAWNQHIESHRHGKRLGAVQPCYCF